MVQTSAEKLEHIGPAQKERLASVPQREQLAKTEPPLPKGKGTEPSVQSTPDRKEGESQGEREPHLDERGDQSGSMERKGWTPQ